MDRSKRRKTPDETLVLTRHDKVTVKKQRTRQLHKPWQNQVHLQQFHFLNHDLGDKAGAEEHLLEAERLLKKFEEMERLSLLELTVWKAACISRARDTTLPKDVKTVGDALLYTERNRDCWKDYRTAMRSSNAVEIVIKHVHPFIRKTSSPVPAGPRGDDSSDSSSSESDSD